ncbi:MAG: adenylyltransferase/cytidyltransferase family protein [Methylococcales bacterium]|jgi:rfaE bifunctional protein nucleotidyltransferase chain/domain|nr:adenylyltransferase/cytidyltransferase family protein [Methylococcales bacterium]MBT7411414.1 adenylyltransferase/cytidyltransferase family protein [Methylococcales bacterium]
MNDKKVKVVSLEQMAQHATQFQTDKKSIVLCHGTFDLMHPGHIKHLQRAAEEGDYLFVTITADDFINKGPGRPVFTGQIRAETLASLDCVVFVAICHSATAIEAIDQVRPDVYVKGSEYQVAADDVTGNIQKEIDAVTKNAGRVFYTDEPIHSSTKLINEHFCVFEPATKLFLEKFRDQYTSKQIIEMLDELKNKRVAVVGDAIIDEYHYSESLGQSGKGNVMVVQYNNEERFAGGSIAVANHLAGFVENVALATGLGKKKSHQAYIESKLANNIDPQFFFYENASTLVKRRYVTSDMAKLFEVYFCDIEQSNELDDEACHWMQQSLKSYDIVVVPDFGNGFISPVMVNGLVEYSNYLAVNTQINSGNRGFHVINRYSHVDFVSLNEPEVRLAAHNLYDPIEQVAKQVGERVNAKQIAITQGPKGAVLMDLENEKKYHVPALSTKVVDRIGAGDTFLSLTALCSGSDLPADLSVFVGSVAAALDVLVVCNREPTKPVDLYKYMTTLLK